MIRFAKAAAVLAAAGALSTGFVTQSASATTSAKTNFNLAAVGSDTVYCVDQKITAAWNAKVKATTGNHIYNVPPIGGVDLGCGTTPTTYTVPADSVHGAIQFANPPVPPDPQAPPGNGNACAAPMQSVPMPWEFPDGSSLGITCYTDDQGAGDMAYTRSSRGRASTDPTNLQFWADALDAVTWSSNSTHAPKSLNPTQIKDIVTCVDTTWGQVNGNPTDTTPISVWYPQTGSGTGAFFAQIFLGNVYPTPSSCLPSSHFVEENDGKAVTDANAFYPYSFALHTAQTNGTETNITNHFKLFKVNGTLPSFTTISEAAALINAQGGDACTATPVKGQFCATRYVYHTAWTEVPAAVYKADISLMGVPSSGKPAGTSVCDNTYASTFKKYGFTPLVKATTSQTTGGVPGKSFCREF